jgi:hypothetical protein
VWCLFQHECTLPCMGQVHDPLPNSQQTKVRSAYKMHALAQAFVGDIHRLVNLSIVKPKLTVTTKAP